MTLEPSTVDRNSPAAARADRPAPPWAVPSFGDLFADARDDARATVTTTNPATTGEVRTDDAFSADAAPDQADLVEAAHTSNPTDPSAVCFTPATDPRDVRPHAGVTQPPGTATTGGQPTSARDLTSRTSSAVETQRARLRLAHPSVTNGDETSDDLDGAGRTPAGAEPPDPSRVQMAGTRHSARHQAARTHLAGLHEMLRAVVEASGSDLHLTTGAAPTVRIHGDLQRMADHGPMAAEELALLLAQTVDADQWRRFVRMRELDFAYTAPGIGRFRVNLYQQRGGYGAAFRAIPREIPELATLGLPQQVEQFAHLPRGLVLVTGPTGSGKSTTLASLLALANRTRRPHIVTIEDPIEFVHEHGEGLVNQREVGSDTESFAAALTHALRQDPDVILVGELRDLETTATALTAAETGHLVFATLHTQSAAQTIDRIIDIFPTDQQGEVRAQLSTSLRGVVTQALCPRSDRPGRAVVTEIMVATPAIRNLIREGKTHQIPSFMQAGGRDGMLTFDQNLAELVQHGVIDFDRALSVCHSPEELGRLARGARA